MGVGGRGAEARREATNGGRDARRGNGHAASTLPSHATLIPVARAQRAWGGKVVHEKSNTPRERRAVAMRGASDRHMSVDGAEALESLTVPERESTAEVAESAEDERSAVGCPPDLRRVQRERVGILCCVALRLNPGQVTVEY